MSDLRDRADSVPARVGPIDRWAQRWAGMAILIFLALTIGYSFARSPWWDEGLYADVANQVAREGQLGSTVMAPVGTFGTDEVLPKMDRYTYWTTPAYPIAVGLWFRAVGTGMVEMRLLSVLFGLLLLGSWWYIVRYLTRSPPLAYAAVGLIALSSHVLWSASIGRPESMSAGLASAAIAVYLRWRERSIGQAAALSAALFALAGLAHPLALVEALACLALVVMLDRKRLRPHHALIVAGIGAVIIAPWVLYVIQDLETFRAQWGANSSARGNALTQPIRYLLTDFADRYVVHHFSVLHGIARLRVAELIGLVACLVVGLSLPRIRRTPGLGMLAALALVSWASLAVLDANRWVQYFAHVFPVYIAAAAVVLVQLARAAMLERAVAVAIAAMLVAPGLGGFVRGIWTNPYRTEYLATVAEVRRHQEPGVRIVGSSELAFALGFDGAFTDDMQMRTQPDLFVAGDMYVLDGSRTWQQRVRQELAADYDLIHENGRFRLFKRRGGRDVTVPPRGSAEPTSITRSTMQIP